MILSYRGRSATFDPDALAFRPLAAGHERAAPPALPPPHAAPPPARRRERCLQRLVVNANNFCNLDCVYCYARGGDYGGPHEALTADTGRRALECFFDRYEQIEAIQWFGGEPLLNGRVIEQLCEYGWTLADRRGRRRPNYTLITNGTVLTPQIIEMIARYDIRVTVSLDGPPHINDRLRRARARGRRGVSRQVEANMRLLKAETGQPMQAEGTFTRMHVTEECSVNDVLDYIGGSLGIAQLHMPMCVHGGAPGEDAGFAVRPEDFERVKEAYADAVAGAVHALASKPVDQLCLLRSALDIIEPLLGAAPPAAPLICAAGSDTLAVDSNGDVYPCFMFYRVDRFRLGSVVHAGRPVVQEDRSRDFRSLIGRVPIPGVTTSWARRFHRGCAGGNYFANGSPGLVSRREVELVEAMVGAAVVELAHLTLDPGRWRFLPHALDLYKLYLAAPAERAGTDLRGASREV